MGKVRKETKVNCFRELVIIKDKCFDSFHYIEIRHGGQGKVGEIQQHKLCCIKLAQGGDFRDFGNVLLRHSNFHTLRVVYN